MLTPEMLLAGYKLGCFPMAEDRSSSVINWYAPDPRAILPFESFHVPRSLARLVRKKPFDVYMNRDFRGTIEECANRERTWISKDIIRAYVELHQMGHAHSIECWKKRELVGGLYGVSIGGAFFGESMFHRVRDASKVSLVYLVHTLRRKGYLLHDTQFSTPHLKRFGVIEIPRVRYEVELKKAIQVHVGRWGESKIEDLQV